MASSPNFQFFFLRDEKSHKLNLLPLEKNEQTLIYHQRILQGFFSRVSQIRACRWSGFGWKCKQIMGPQWLDSSLNDYNALHYNIDGYRHINNIISIVSVNRTHISVDVMLLIVWMPLHDRQASLIPFNLKRLMTSIEIAINDLW